MAILKLAEQDSELGLGHGPLARWHDPLFLGAVQHQEEEFCGGVGAGSGQHLAAVLRKRVTLTSLGK